MRATLLEPIEDRWPNRDGDPVFARSVVVGIGRTGTRRGNVVYHLDAIFVVCRGGVTLVSHPDCLATRYTCERERFVLSALCDASRVGQCFERMHSGPRPFSESARTPQGAEKISLHCAKDLFARLVIVDDM
jgi:hypothetical protein